MNKQGSHSNSHRLANIDDLDALLARHSLAPQVVRLGGEVYQIRTDLTADETSRFLVLMGKGFDAQAFTFLVGTKAERQALTAAMRKSESGEQIELPAGRKASQLDRFLDDLPMLHRALASARIMRTSRVLAQRAKSDADIYAEYGYEPTEDAEPVEQGESSAS